MIEIRIRCTCNTVGNLHAITCLITAAGQPHAMVNDALEVFYPDGPEDAQVFALHHGAEMLNPDFSFPHSDDPTPTTGGPFDDYELSRPDGCTCYVREDPEYGETWTRPAGGCPVHNALSDRCLCAVQENREFDMLWDRSICPVHKSILSGRPGWRPAGVAEDGTPETPGELSPELAADQRQAGSLITRADGWCPPDPPAASRLPIAGGGFCVPSSGPHVFESPPWTH